MDKKSLEEIIVFDFERPALNPGDARDLEMSRKAALLGISFEDMVTFMDIKQDYDSLQELEEAETTRLTTGEAIKNAAAETARSAAHITLNGIEMAFSILPSNRRKS